MQFVEFEVEGMGKFKAQVETTTQQEMELEREVNELLNGELAETQTKAMKLEERAKRNLLNEHFKGKQPGQLSKAEKRKFDQLWAADNSVEKRAVEAINFQLNQTRMIYRLEKVLIKKPAGIERIEDLVDYEQFMTIWRTYEKAIAPFRGEGSGNNRGLEAIREVSPMSRQSEMRTTYTARGLPRYEIEIRHDGLSKYQLVRGDDSFVVERKVYAKMVQWDEMWRKRVATEEKRREHQNRIQEIEEKKQLAAQRTKETQNSLWILEGILAHTLHVDDAVDWDLLKDKSDYPEPKPEKPDPPSMPDPPEIPVEPRPSDSEYQVKLSILERIFPSRKLANEKETENHFKRDFREWQEAKKKESERYKSMITEYERKIKAQEEEHKAEMHYWEEKRQEYLKQRDEGNAAIDRKRDRYLTGNPEAVFDYCDIVLANSEYPDYFPQSYELDYIFENKLLIVDYQLPSPASIPTVNEVKYAQLRDEFVEKHISEAQFNKLYDNLLYQIALRTVHELYEADKIDALESVVFNGYVRSIDQATGQETNGCVLSLQANKVEFEQINLKNVDPKACFKKLKGIGSPKLHSLTPIAPIVISDRDDKRFVTPYGVVDNLEEGDNLAAMDWQDFEHLIRELFEKEFAVAHGEVKVTRASRDGGIDAVAFDPDPLRGGKIVIQAKRYTNTVGISAVRDLYGTVLNEGANKGILVTTSDYGPDAYEFAKGKPLRLLSGNNLLHLLQKHGHKAKIDLREAKKILAEEKRSE